MLQVLIRSASVSINSIDPYVDATFCLGLSVSILSVNMTCHYYLMNVYCNVNVLLQLD